jgi:ABC-2 type transport system ATP-binding protein
MVHSPSLVMLDEPVSALDPVGRRDVIEMLRELKKQTTILFSTHVLNDAEEVCDDIIIIRNGEMALSGTLGELREQHQQDVISISVTGDYQEWAESLRKYDVITNVTYEKETIVLMVNQLETARRLLLEQILSNHIPVTSFSIGHSSLEDLFMKVVKS